MYALALCFEEIILIKNLTLLICCLDLNNNGRKTMPIKTIADLDKLIDKVQIAQNRYACFSEEKVNEIFKAAATNPAKMSDNERKPTFFHRNIRSLFQRR